MKLLQLALLIVGAVSLSACSETIIYNPQTIPSTFEGIHLLYNSSELDQEAGGWQNNCKKTSFLEHPGTITFYTMEGYVNNNKGLYVYRIQLELDIDISFDVFIRDYQKLIENEVEAGEVYPTCLNGVYYFTKGTENIIVTPHDEKKISLNIELNKMGMIKSGIIDK